MNIKEFFHTIAPKSEQTVIRNGFTYKGFQFKNNLGYPCEYVIHTAEGKELGMVKYYRGRLLSAYKLVPTQVTQ